MIQSAINMNGLSARPATRISSSSCFSTGLKTHCSKLLRSLSLSLSLTFTHTHAFTLTRTHYNLRIHTHWKRDDAECENVEMQLPLACPEHTKNDSELVYLFFLTCFTFHIFRFTQIPSVCVFVCLCVNGSTVLHDHNSHSK